MNLIWQYYIGDHAPWVKGSTHAFSNYAKKVGADYLFSDNDPKFVTGNLAPHFEVLRLVYDEMFDSYDKVLFVDADIHPETDESIFDVEIDELGIFHEGGEEHVHKTYYNRPGHKFGWHNDVAWRNFVENEYNIKIPQPTSWPNEEIIRYNSGVMVWTKEARHKARALFPDAHHYYNSNFTGRQHSFFNLDQNFITAASVVAGLGVVELHKKWNYYHIKDNPYNGTVNFRHCKKTC